MKKIKTIFAIVLTLCLLVSSMPTKVVAAQKIKLNKKSLTLYAGKSQTLKLKGTTRKPKWSSSNKSVATVTNKGKIKAKKQGTTKVTAKLGKKKYTCKVKVKNYTVKDIYYISDRSIEYNSAYDEQRVFFSLKAKDGNKRLSASGKIAMKITNNNNEIVYNKTQNFNSSNFSNWTSALSGTRYLCCIKIPSNTIAKGTSSKGKINFTVTLSDGRAFSEGNLFSISNLPEKNRQTEENEHVNISISDISGTYLCGSKQAYTLSKVWFDCTYYSYKNSNTVKIYFNGTKTYDSKGSSYSQRLHIGWKLYDANNAVIDSGTANTSNVAIGESFVNASDYIFNLPDGDYRLEILNTDS